MNKYAYIFSALLMASGLIACDQDHKPDWSETAPFEIKMESASIADGQEVSPEVIDIIVAYDHDIAINSLAKITLNGQEVDNPRVLEGEPNSLSPTSILKGERNIRFISRPMRLRVLVRRLSPRS